MTADLIEDADLKPAAVDHGEDRDGSVGLAEKIPRGQQVGCYVCSVGDSFPTGVTSV